MKKMNKILLAAMILCMTGLLASCKETAPESSDNVKVESNSEAGTETQEQSSQIETETATEKRANQTETETQEISEEPAPDMEIIEETEVVVDEGSGSGVL